MKVLVLGAQSNVGARLIKYLDVDIEVIAVFLDIPFVENKNLFLGQNVTTYFIKEIKQDLLNVFSMESKIDFIVNCQNQPFDNLAREDPSYDSLMTYQAPLFLAEVSRQYGFSGPLINLSSFHVYANSPTAMPMKVGRSRFEILPPKTDEQNYAEHRFGYDYAYGISEGMIYAPKDPTIYSMHISLVEKYFSTYMKGPVLNLRLPYMLHYQMADEYIIKYADRVNNILLRLSKGQKIISTLDDMDKVVYDFLTPEYVATLIKNIVEDSMVIEGAFNLSGVNFSELELIKVLKSFDIEIEWLEKSPDNWHKPINYYWADDRKLRDIIALPKKPTLRELVMKYLDNCD